MCLAWGRPFWIAAILTVAAFVLEGLQALTPTHSPNLLSVLGGASGSWLAALIVEAIRVASNRRKSPSIKRENFLRLYRNAANGFVL